MKRSRAEIQPPASRASNTLRSGVRRVHAVLQPVPRLGADARRGTGGACPAVQNDMISGEMRGGEPVQ